MQCLGEGSLILLYVTDRSKFPAIQNNSNTDFSHKYFFFFTIYNSPNMIFF